MGLRGVAAAGLAAVGLWVVGAAQVEAQRLPGGVRPVHYSLKITPDLERATFKGVETIDVVLDHETDSITLNAAELTFTSVLAAPEKMPVDSPCAKDLGAYQPDFATVELDHAKEQATLTFRCAMSPGKVRLDIEYTGTINSKLRGFYLSEAQVKAPGGAPGAVKTLRYGVTQFEATDARRAFPSFDEPALKATFDVSVVAGVGEMAISNTQVVSDTPGPERGKHTVTFARTPVMSTYLVAWLVGDFACSEGKADGVPIRACATPDKAKLTPFALESAKWMLHFYDQYFGIKYPLAKLDLVAVPDFEAGAMENFGCITFRETEMLVDEKNGAVEQKKEVASTIAHEMSHQWFGDMVTMQWWDNLWLNEGFATWMETKAAAQWKPEWRYEENVASDLDDTLDVDAEPTTRAIRSKAETPEEINEMFDDIAYGKAGSVIGMVENWVGEDVFRKGVQEYLSAHLYGNATAEDFWDTLTQVSGQPVDRVMRSFVEQPGVPVVTLGSVEGGKVSVGQKRLVVAGLGSAGKPDVGVEASSGDVVKSDAERWTVPICFKGAPCRLMSPESATMETAPGLLFANAGDKGYYRTSYAPEDAAALVKSAESQLTASERIGLLGDRWALTRAGMGSVGGFLDLVLAVKNDPSATVLDEAMGTVREIDRLIASNEDRTRLHAAVLKEFGPVYTALGPPNRHEPWQKADLRETLFEALGDAGDPAVLAEAKKVAEALFAGQRPADINVADAAMILAAAKGDEAMYDKLMILAKNATDPGLKADSLRLLTRFEQPILVIRTLQYAVSDEVRSQDSWELISLELAHRATQDLAWEYVEQHWTAIDRKATVNSGVRIVEATGAFCSAVKRDEIQAFLVTHPVASERTVARAMDSINACIALRTAQAPALKRWLNEQETGHTGAGTRAGIQP